jgi:hypothetical protein
MKCLAGFEKFKHNDRVAMVGFAPTSRHMAPFNDPTFDLWGMNEAATLELKNGEERWWKGGETAWFQIHPKWDFMRRNNRNDYNHWRWLQGRDGSIPIFMQHKFKDVPGSVRYPLEELLDLTGQYLTSSFSYMMGLAILMGYKEIALFGFEMSHDSEYIYQKAGAEYLLGFAKGMGINVMLPPNCSLLRGNLYAYEDLRAADRTYLGATKEHIEMDLDRDLEVQHRVAGKLELLNELLEPIAPLAEDEKPNALRAELLGNNPPMPVRMYLANLVNPVTEEYRKASNQYAYQKGLFDKTLGYIKWHDNQNIPDDREILDFRTEEEKNEQAKPKS